ncbi:diguanylate cyclase domain-containing protein [Geothrix rubra]|nr:diguanylate cyclase [Geothrix rubra]
MNPPPRLRHLLLRYGLPLVLVVLAALLRIWPLRHEGTDLAWATFYPAVVVAAIYGGLTAGLLATALSCVTVLFCWPLLVAQPFITGSTDYLRLVVFVVVGTIVSKMTEATRRARAESIKSTQALAESEHFLKTIANSLPGLIAYWDKDLRCRFANHSFLDWFGKAPEAMIGTSIQELMGKRLFSLNEPYIRGALKGEMQQFERTLTKVDGSIAHTLANYVPDIKANGEVAGFFVLVSEVTLLKEAEAKLQLAASVFHNTVEGILVTDADLVILSVNPAFTHITGYGAEEAIGKTPRMLKSKHHDQAFYAAMWRDIDATGHWQGEIWNRRKDGEVYLEWLTITKIHGSMGEPIQYVSVFNDITKSRYNDERIKHLAFHDALTDLPNRSLLMDRLDHQIAKAEREGSRLAVMFLDLDRFKGVNDTLGHEVGDDLLRMVSQKLLAQVRQSDTVSRLGGDEFVILLDNPANEDEVAHVAGRVLTVIQEPMEFRGKAAQIGTSIGIAMFPRDGSTPDELIERADAAMYAAKDGGRNTYRFFQQATGSA